MESRNGGGPREPTSVMRRPPPVARRAGRFVKFRRILLPDAARFFAAHPTSRRVRRDCRKSVVSGAFSRIFVKFKGQPGRVTVEINFRSVLLCLKII